MSVIKNTIGSAQPIPTASRPFRVKLVREVLGAQMAWSVRSETFTLA